jgi:hypothetical protein
MVSEGQIGMNMQAAQRGQFPHMPPSSHHEPMRFRVGVHWEMQVMTSSSDFPRHRPPVVFPDVDGPLITFSARSASC